MPKAGIHGTRSTNWNSAEPAWNAAQIATVSANSTSEMPSASQRNRLLRRPPALPMRSSRIAPASGTPHERVSSGTATLFPQVITQDQHHAHEERAGIGADRSGL